MGYRSKLNITATPIWQNGQLPLMKLASTEGIERSGPKGRYRDCIAAD
jgi:hypothetical protein